VSLKTFPLPAWKAGSTQGGHVADIPRHPEADEATMDPSKPGWTGYLIGAAVALLVVLVVVLHLTGVIGGGAH